MTRQFMKIYSWNVNGIRAAIKKGLLKFLQEYSPDVLLIQEIKVSQDVQVQTEFDFKNYQEFWHSAKRPGYSGTAILLKKGKKANYLPILSWDDEGRIQVLDFKRFYLLNIYFPNANHELSRLDFKIKFNHEVLNYLQKLVKQKPVIVGGDFNVAHQEIDLARPKDNVGNAGFTSEERVWLDKLLATGFIDTFRHYHKDKVQYSWWTYRFNARARNIGWRVDYFCASAKMIKYIKDAFILDKVLGSDHAPVGVDLGF